MVDVPISLPEFEPGWVWLAGAGPGDPGLLTLHALHGIQSADVIVYDALVGDGVLRLAPSGTVLEYAGKRGGKPSPKQRDISLRLIELARLGKRVLRLKGGDPFMFGRGGEEALALVRAHVPFRVIPGVTAGTAAPAYAGIPVTHRDTNSVLTFVTGHDALGDVPGSVDWAAIAKSSPVIVMYMALKHLADIAVRLLDAGRRPEEAVAIVSRATTEQQQVVETTLERVAQDAEAAGLEPPALVILGEVVRLREALDWFGAGSGRSAAVKAVVTPAAGDAREMMSAPTLIVAAPASGSGKTVTTLALLRHFANAGLAVASFKAGPDYIDPAFHAAASGHPCRNLDAWAMRPETLANTFAAAADGVELVLGEGVMGLFDGATDGTGSTADLAAMFELPVVLVIDVAGQAASAAAVLKGFNEFRSDVHIAGVIFNRVGGPGHVRALEEASAPLGVPLLGCVPRDPALELPDRHLGLVPAAEHGDLDAFLDGAARAVAAHVDTTALRGLAIVPDCGSASGLPLAPLGQRIACATDAAFAFTYPHIIDGWRAAGAEVLPFSPLADEAPDDLADAIYLPGGYPELHAGRLAGNSRFLGGLGAAARRGDVLYGECGGYMVLGEVLIDATGAAHRMAGLLPVATSFAERRLHLGYRHLTLREAGSLGPQGQAFRGHEFHYASIVAEDTVQPLFDATDARGEQAAALGTRRDHVMGSFAHLVDRA